MKEPAARFEQIISRHIHFNETMVPMYSTSLQAKITTPGALSASYWAHGMASAVQFEDTVRSMIKDMAGPQLVFVEIGAHSALAAPLRQIFQTLQDVSPGQEPVYVPTLTRNDVDAKSQLLATIGRLHCLGASVDMLSVTGLGRVLPDLGAYPWKKQVKSRESRIVREWRMRTAPHHELLGSRVTAMPDAEPAWRNILRLGDVLWLGDHVLCGTVVFPAAGYIAMAGAACGQLHPACRGYSIRNLSLTSFLTMKARHPVEILTTLKRAKYNDLTESDWYTFTISAHDGKSWGKYCTGEVRSAEADQLATTSPSRPEALQRRLDAASWYNLTRKLGYEYGPNLRKLHDMSVDPVDVAAVGSIPCHDDVAYALHPTKIDHCLQLMGVAAVKGLPHRIDDMEVPFSIGLMHVAGDGAGPLRVSVKGVDDGNRSLRWEATAAGESGKAAFSIAELRSVVVDRFRKHALSTPLFTQLRWEPLLDLLPSKGAKHIKALGSAKDFLALLGHAQPTMRILQVGAGGYESAKAAIEHLTTAEGVRLFSSYTYTDPTNSSLDAARLQFNEAEEDITFKLFDASRGIKNQGVEADSFDLVIASNFSQSQLQASLKVMHEVLAPSGWLLLHNNEVICEDTIDGNYVVVNGDDATANINNSKEQPKAKEWEAALQGSGFSLVHSLPEDGAASPLGPNPFGECTFARNCIDSDNSLDTAKEVTLLCSPVSDAWSATIAACLRTAGYAVSLSTLDDNNHTPGCNVISLLDLGDATLDGMSEQAFYQLRDYLMSTRARHILWLTRPAQATCENPGYGMAHGLLRTLRRERALPVSILELNPADPLATESIVGVHDWILESMDSGRQGQDNEFVTRNGVVHVVRHHWADMQSALSQGNSTPSTGAKRLHFPNSLLQEGSWIPSVDTPSLGQEDVEVDISYVGLNFRVCFTLCPSLNTTVLTLC